MAGRRVDPRVLAGAGVAVAALVALSPIGFGGRADGPAPGGAADVNADPESPIRVEVLNGAGRPDLARRATERLRAQGFDVVYFGNAESFGRARSVVLDRVEGGAAARAAAAAVGVDSVEHRPDPSLYLDATIILGEDWTADAAADDDGARSWLRRLRRWLIGGREPPG